MPTEHTVDSGEGYFKSDFLMVMLRLFLDPARIKFKLFQVFQVAHSMHENCTLTFSCLKLTLRVLAILKQPFS